jgi:acyl carrier protein
VARWLAAEGAEHLLLTSRHGPDAVGAAELRAELAEFGAEVTITACDVADPEALSGLLAAVPERFPLTGVVHAAGVRGDGVLDGLTPDRLGAVLRPKSDAAWSLHEQTRELDLSLFVLFSSVAGVLGGTGQGGYAAANAVLDAIAEHRRGLGLAALSVAWGPWTGGGMAADATVEQRMHRTGIRALAPDLAISALSRAVRCGDGVVTVADIDWARFAPELMKVCSRPLLDDLAEAAVVRTRTETESLPVRMAAMPEPERVTTLIKLVRTTAAAVLGHDGPDSIKPDQAFQDLGFDSLTAVEFSNQLSVATGLRLARTTVFDHPTPAVLAHHLMEQILPGEAGTADAAATEFDRLEKALGDLVQDDRTAGVVRARLQALLLRWTPADDPAEGSGLLAASDEEVFDFIGKELGIS